MKQIISVEDQLKIDKSLSNIFGVQYIAQEYEEKEIDISYQNHPEINPFFGKEHDTETRLHLSKMQSTKIGQLNQFYGKKHTPEVIENNRNKNIQILTKLKGKKVNQYDVNGQFIKTHDSVRSAARNIGVKHYNQISKCCRGMISYSYGYIWKYA